jgi:hypothetical protein
MARKPSIVATMITSVAITSAKCLTLVIPKDWFIAILLISWLIDCCSVNKIVKTSFKVSKLIVEKAPPY